MPISAAIATPQTANWELSPAPSAFLRRFAWAVLVYFIATILWGAVVRATGSGAGCGDHWPLCNGTVFQHSPTVATVIEFTHRLTAALDMILIVGLLVWSWRGTVVGHLARRSAAAAVFFTLTEGALGALLVKLGYTAESHDPMRAPFLALHFANTLLLIAAIALTAHLLGRGSAFRRGQVRLLAPLANLVGLFSVLVVGVTGSLAALGDTLFPPSSLESSLAQDFAGTGSWLVRWRWTHPAISVVATVYILWLLIRASRRRQSSRNGPASWSNQSLAGLVLALLAAQYLLGILDIALLAPVWMQVAHLLGADALWSALVVLSARLALIQKDESADMVRQGNLTRPFHEALPQSGAALEIK